MNWHITDPRIRCVADREGAQVFVVHIGAREVRVLTFSQPEAKGLARNTEVEAPSKEETLL